MTKRLLVCTAAAALVAGYASTAWANPKVAHNNAPVSNSANVDIQFESGGENCGGNCSGGAFTVRDVESNNVSVESVVTLDQTVTGAPISVSATGANGGSSGAGGTITASFDTGSITVSGLTNAAGIFAVATNTAPYANNAALNSVAATANVNIGH